MKMWLRLSPGALALALLLWGAGPRPAGAAEPLVTSFSDFWGQDDSQPRVGTDVAIEAGVLYYDPAWRLLFLQDATRMFYMAVPADGFPILQGQRVRLTGRIAETNGERSIGEPRFEIIPGEAIPEPVALTIRELAAPDPPGTWVVTEGTVRWLSDQNGPLEFTLSDGTNQINCIWREFPRDHLDRWRHARVRVQGVQAARQQDGKPAGGQIFIPRLQDVELIEPAAEGTVSELQVSEVWPRPSEPPVVAQRVRITGDFQRQIENGLLVVRADAGRVLVESRQPFVVPAGTAVFAEGLPAMVAGSPRLQVGS